MRSKCLIAIAVSLAVSATSGAGPAGAQSCSACVDVVTTFDPDGTGPAAPRTRLHAGLLTQVPHAIDVDTNLPPVPLGVLPLIPGYDLRTNVIGLDAAKPRVVLERLLTAPVLMPLRAEVVTGSDGTFTSFGYDTLNSNAPRSFAANIDTSNRDGDPMTEQARFDAAITGALVSPGKSLTVVTETFGGAPAGTRTGRSITRLTYSGNNTQTKVPGVVSADLTSPSKDPAAPQRTQIMLTRDVRTKLDFELSGTARTTTGSVDELPATTLLTLAKVDGETRIDFEASTRIARAEVATHEARSSTKAVIHDVPNEGGLTFAAPADKAIITYWASEPAARARIESSAETGPRISPVSTRISADVRDVPTEIERIDHTTLPGGGRIVYFANERADFAEVKVRRGTTELDATIGGAGHTDAVPANIENLTYSSTTATSTAPGAFRIDYTASDRVPRLEVRNKRLLQDPPPLGNPELVPPPHVREITTTIDDLPAWLELSIGTGGKLGYGASGQIARVHVLGTGERPFFGRATELDLLLAGLPTHGDASFKGGEMLVDAHGGQFGSVALLAHDGTPLMLDADQDGLLLRDQEGNYTLHTRINNLRRFNIGKTVFDNGSVTNVALDALNPGGRKIRIDSTRDVVADAYTEPRLRGDGTVGLRTQSRPATETLVANAPSLPPNVNADLAQEPDNGNMNFVYTADGVAASLELARSVTFKPGSQPIGVTYEQPYFTEHLPSSYPATDFNSEQHFALEPVPRHLQVCRYGKTNTCTADVFTDSMFEDFRSGHANKGSLRMISDPPTKLFMSEAKTRREEFEVTLGGGFACTAADCESHKPMEIENWVSLDVADFALQAHQSATTGIGPVIGQDSKGYLALDLDELARPGRITVDVFRDTRSERGADYSALGGLRPTTGNVLFKFPTGFVADRRVFEANPDEGNFWKHLFGTITCPEGTVMETGGTALHDHACSGLLTN